MKILAALLIALGGGFYLWRRRSRPTWPDGSYRQQLDAFAAIPIDGITAPRPVPWTPYRGMTPRNRGVASRGD